MTQKWRNWTTFQKKYSLQSFICGQYLIDFISKYRNVASDRNENGLDLQTEHIETRKESRGAPFRDNIQKCIMQLVGELDVPTTKVSQVLQSVSKWLYDKDIDKSELPSTATANNFVDIPQVLGKYQLAEELVESDRWDLHGDGTSRDCKKIIEQQVTLDSGK